MLPWQTLGLSRLARRVIAGWACVALMIWNAGPAAAADKLGNSLDLVPADASFYAAGFRMREQIELVANSNAWSALTNMASVQLGLQQLRSELTREGGQLEPIQKFFEEEENQKLLELAKDLGSHEIFIFGDKQFAPTLGLLNKAYGSIYYSQLLAQLANQGQPPEDPSLIAAGFLQTLSADLGNVEIPNLVIGFKLTQPQLAEQQMQRLELLLTRLLAPIPQILERFKRVKIGDGSFLSLTIDGNLVPWDEIPWGDLETEAGEFDKLRNKLQQLNLNVSIGVKDGYALIFIGGSNELLSKLGQGDLLINGKEFEILKPHLTKKLTGVAWTSKELVAVSSTFTPENIDGLAELAETALPLSELGEDLQERISKDVHALVEDLKPHIPEPGAMLNFSFMSDRGAETFTYDWTQNLRLDPTKPLPLIENVGGNALLISLSRGKVRPEDYDLLVKWLNIGYGYFTDEALQRMPDPESEQAKVVIEKILPLVKKVDQINRKYLLPALMDGQAGIVIDAKIKSKQWIGPMPPADKELPMLEIALFTGVSDPAKLQSGFGELHGVANELLEVIRELDPGSVPPNYKIPTPKSRKVESGEVFWYDVPAEAQLDKQVMPHVGLNSKLALFSTSPKLTQRMFTPQPLMASPFLAEAAKKPIADLTYVNFSGLLENVMPWVEYGFEQNAAQRGRKVTDTPEVLFIQSEIRSALKVLSCMRSYSSYTYQEKDAMVTHGLLIVQDVE